MTRPVTLAALGALLVSVHTLPLRAQQGAGAPRRLDPAIERTIALLADSADAAGLPGEALRAKAAEGVLKGAADDRILAAVRTFARELREAHRALGAATAGELVAGATALHAGVAPERLRELRQASGGAREGALAVPIVVLVDLVTRRVPPDDAIRSIELLLRRRAGDAELQAFRQTVEQDILSGQSPSAAVAARTRAVLDRLGGGLERPGRPEGFSP